jgi:hypothetical protein
MSCRRGYTLMEAIGAFMLASGILAAVTSYFLYSFKLSIDTRKDGEVISNIHLAFNYVEKKMFDVDNIYIATGLDDHNTAVVIPQKVIFRTTYLPENAAYDGTFNSLKSKWGVFWYQPLDEHDNEINEFRYFESQEVAYHATTDLIWKNPLIVIGIDDVRYTYNDKKMTVSIKYMQNKKQQTRTMIFFYAKAKRVPDKLAENQEPTWPAE